MNGNVYTSYELAIAGLVAAIWAVAIVSAVILARKMQHLLWIGLSGVFLTVLALLIAFPPEKEEPSSGQTSIISPEETPRL